MNSLLTTLTILVVFTGAYYAQSNNAFWGQVGWNDTLVYYNAVQKNSSILQVVELDVQYPPKGVINNRLISAIRAFDQKTNGNGAKASIVGGGINSTSVVVRFKSIRGHGINFLLEIYVR